MNESKRRKYSWQRKRHVRASLHEFLARRDGPNCFYCECVFTTDNHKDGKYLQRQRTIDHWIPVSRGGTEHPSNLRLACIECNTTKDKMTGEEFLSSAWCLSRKQKIAQEKLATSGFLLIKAFTHSEIIFTGKMEWSCTKCGKAMSTNPAYIPCKPLSQTVEEADFIKQVEANV